MLALFLVPSIFLFYLLNEVSCSTASFRVGGLVPHKPLPPSAGHYPYLTSSHCPAHLLPYLPKDCQKSNPRPPMQPCLGPYHPSRPCPQPNLPQSSAPGHPHAPKYPCQHSRCPEHPKPVKPSCWFCQRPHRRHHPPHHHSPGHQPPKFSLSHILRHVYGRLRHGPAHKTP